MDWGYGDGQPSEPGSYSYSYSYSYSRPESQPLLEMTP